MLIVNPDEVVFAGQALDEVRQIVVDRRGVREVVEFGDLGPHAVFCDIPEVRVEVRVRRELLHSVTGGPVPGDMGDLLVRTAPTGGDAIGTTLSCQAVVMRVTHDIRAGGGAIQTITLLAISPDGAGDPLQES